jgi:ubiquinone/menaquinone biosynthesis C-methylase UbiE
LDGIEEKLKAGAKVADVGCGHGASTIVMAQAYPNSQFFGFDYHAPSIERAKVAAKEAGVGDRITFAQASAKDFPAKGYDLVAFFDCLHDMGDPVGAGRHVKETLAKDGAWMIVEPFAHDNLKDNLNPVGRVYYGASTFICTPASLSQEVALGLGGFTRFRRATETPFNMIFEARA